jgi:type III secretion system FlhB-like substrate exporter
MQLYAILNELWRRRIIVGIALIVSILLGLMVAFKVSPGLPPKLTPRAKQVGVASTRVLINTPSSIVADLNPAGGSSLSTHAQLLGNLISSDEVHNAIAKSAGLAPTDLTIAPLAVGGVIQTPLAVTAPAPVGASSVSVNADPLLPLITITATAPTPKVAASLANGSVNVLQSYIQTVAAEEGIPASRRPVITSLGSALGLPSTSGPSKMYSAVAMILLFGLSCYVILIVTGGKARIRELKELRALEYEQALARMSPTEVSGGPAAPPVSDVPPTRTRAAAAVDGSAPSLAHLRQFDAGAGLLTISDDLGRARAATHAASALEELQADAASRVDSTHGEVRSETTRSTHASPHRRGVRSAAGQTLFSRFSRS